MAKPGAIDKHYSWKHQWPKRPLRRFWTRLAAHPSRAFLAQSQPIIIGATGVSGTKALRQSLVSAGIYMANHVNQPGDALDFSRFLNRHLNGILSETRSVDYALDALSPRLRADAEKAFLQAVRAHLADAPDGMGPWGFKVPRSIYILPLIQEILPRFRFIHLVRDGRDMVVAENQFQFTHHYRAFAGENADPDPVKARLLMWSAVNEQARNWALGEMGERYRVVRFEDLAAAPEATLGGLFAWLGVEVDRARLAMKIKPSDPATRRREPAQSEISEVTRKIAPALAAFGYI